MIHGSDMWSVRKDEQEFRGITEMRSGWMIGIKRIPEARPTAIMSNIRCGNIRSEKMDLDD